MVCQAGKGPSINTHWRLPSTPPWALCAGPPCDRRLIECSLIPNRQYRRLSPDTRPTELAEPPHVWFYWSRALGPRPCWHAQFHCSIMDRLRRGLQHRGQIAGPAGQHTTSSDEQMNMWYCDPLASMTSCSIRTVLFNVIFEVLIYWSKIVQGKWGVMGTSDSQT